MVSGALYPNSKLAESVLKKNSAAVSKAVDGFREAVVNYTEKKPSFFRLAIFRMTRSSMKHSEEATSADKKYYSDKGWLESGYYTGVRIGIVKRIFGVLVDRMIRSMIQKSSKGTEGARVS